MLYGILAKVAELSRYHPPFEVLGQVLHEEYVSLIALQLFHKANQANSTTYCLQPPTTQSHNNNTFPKPLELVNHKHHWRSSCNSWTNAFPKQ